ncbi:hypothetical protein P3T76_008830 [Phytophthora citrophthora]|uniref:Uncharacterized protein n=1 Tax=Phytophthora citrophthora TaxID=4793 RepID=A0AAD9GHT7_9STRA|nr:hypothetical protein P3T76_008830 [Phytophthora citrophthora]
MCFLVDKFVDAYSAAANGGAAVPAPPPPPFQIPDSLTRDSFKRAILSYSQVGAAGPYGLTCLPCDFPEVTTAAVRLERFDRHPWTQHIIGVGGAENVLPVGDLLMFKDRTDTLVPAREPLSTSVWNH